MAVELDASTQKVFLDMLTTIRQREYRNAFKSKLFDAKNKLDKVGFSVPPHMVDFQTPVGWADKAVSVPAARIRREGYRLRVESSIEDDLDEMFGDPLVKRMEFGAVKSSLKHGPAFVFVTPGDQLAGEPEVIFSAKSAREATCVQDPRTGIVKAALELVGRHTALFYLPGVVHKMEDRNGWKSARQTITRNQQVPCEPFYWGWDLDRRFGRSRISRPLIGAIQSGVRTLLRQDVTAEFFSAPQRSLMGADEAHFTDKEGNPIDPWKLITGAIWALPDVWDDDEGKLVRPDLKQLQQATMQPHSEMLRSIATRVASETSLPVSYLGVIHDNPASADAIRAAESDMVAMVEHEIRMSYELSSLSLAKKALRVRAVGNGETASALAALGKDLRGLSVRYADPSTVTPSARADAALKYKSTFPDGDPEIAMEIYGLSDEQIRRNLTHATKAKASGVLDSLLGNEAANSRTAEAGAS